MDPAGGGQPPGGGKPGDRRAPLPMPHGAPRAQPAPGPPAASPPQQPGYPPPPQPGYPPPPQPGYPPPPQPGYPPHAYGQPPYPQPGYPPPPYGQPPYAPPRPGQPYPQPMPYAQPLPGQPYPQPMPGQPYPPPPFAPPGPPPPRLAPTDHSFAEFLKISMRRAFRLRIEPAEVTHHERIQLSRDGVTDPVFQAFLAWRRSVLFAFSTAIVPLMLLKAYELYSVEKSDIPIIAEIQSIQMGLGTVPLLAELMFCILAWTQLGRWTQWRKQRRVLAIGWAVFFLAPFVVHLYPLRSVGGDLGKQERLLIGILVSVEAMMVLAPKAVSLIPGIVRASIVTKLLFPGAAAPGWLIVLAAPIYTLFIYVVLVVPLQITGSGYFVVAIVGIILAEFWLGRGGYRLARPLTRDAALAAVKRIRLAYLITLLASCVFMVIALVDLITVFELKPIKVVNLIGTFLTNVWITTLITTDMLIASLDQARGLSAGTSELAADVNVQLGAFVGRPTQTIDAVADPTAAEPKP